MARAPMASLLPCPNNVCRTRTSSPFLPVRRLRLRVARSVLPLASVVLRLRRCCRTQHPVVRILSRTCSAVARRKPRPQLTVLSAQLRMRLRRRPPRPSRQRPNYPSPSPPLQRALPRPRKRSPSPLKNGSRAHDAASRLLLFIYRQTARYLAVPPLLSHTTRAFTHIYPCIPFAVLTRVCCRLTE